MYPPEIRSEMVHYPSQDGAQAAGASRACTAPGLRPVRSLCVACLRRADYPKRPQSSGAAASRLLSRLALESTRHRRSRP
jgi:hypothetical protein